MSEQRTVTIITTPDVADAPAFGGFHATAAAYEGSPLVRGEVFDVVDLHGELAALGDRIFLGHASATEEEAAAMMYSKGGFIVALQGQLKLLDRGFLAEPTALSTLTAPLPPPGLDEFVFGYNTVLNYLKANSSKQPDDTAAVDWRCYEPEAFEHHFVVEARGAEGQRREIKRSLTQALRSARNLKAKLLP